MRLPARGRGRSDTTLRCASLPRSTSLTQLRPPRAVTVAVAVAATLARTIPPLCAFARAQQQIKKIASAGQDPTKPERYRLQLSDGVNKQPSAMLATQLNGLITNNELVQNSVIQLDRYICNTVSDHR